MKNFVVYRSSAGSGKTFTLVKEFLRLALHDETRLYSNYKRILAVTFTNKAAAEMKSRVIEALHQLASGKTDDVMGQLLCRETGTGPAELEERARTVLSQILHHYSDLAIGTIDSFTHRIVKTFAHDLDLPVNFNIELDTQAFYEKVVALLFSKIGEDEYVSRLLKEFALLRVENNSSWDPERQIREFSDLLQKENAGAYITQLERFSADELEAFRKQFLDFIRHYKSHLQEEARKALDLLKANGLTDDDFKYKKSGPQGFFRKCLEGVAGPEEADSSRLRDAIEKNGWAGAKSGNAFEAIQRIGPELNAIALSLIAFIRENHRYYSLCELLARQMYPLMLLKKIGEISEEQKQEERLVFISEFNRRIYDIIHNEPTPFIYERLGERYQHYLLDEFQDTSTLQWHNILPLLDNSLSNGWFNLLVGDGKQSIYRWRNANVKQFAQLPAVENESGSPVMEERIESLARNFEGKALQTNYRSLGTIVGFNNALFDALSEKLPGGARDIYAGQAQQVSRGGEGYITVHTGSKEREELEGFTCGLIAEQVQAALASGFRLRDICVLARYNYQGNLVANYLIGQKIPVVSSDSLLLRNNLEINTLVACLRYMSNSSDQVSAAAVVNYLRAAGRLSEDLYHQCLRQLGEHRHLFGVLQAAGIHFRQETLSLHNLFDACVEIARALELNRQGYHYLRFFLDEVNEFLVMKNSSLPFFFEWWESRQRKASMIIPEGTDAVRIMTIHAGKGLEFPVVIVPFCHWSLYRAGDSWVQVNNAQVQLPVTVVSLSKKAGESGFEKEVEEEQEQQALDNLNLLYVALTRAVERLHVIATASVTSRAPSVSGWIEEFMSARHQPAAENLYTIGAPLPKQGKEKPSSLPAFPLQPLVFDTPGDLVQIKASYLHHSQDVEAARQQGIMLHWLLARLRSEADLPAALDAALLEGLVSRQEVPALEEKLLAIVRHPELEAFFAPGADCRLEAELITGEAELLRPDRIVFTAQETVLIDYKTGREDTKRYAKQLLNYEKALHSMGFTPVRKLLVYLDGIKIVTIN